GYGGALYNDGSGGSASLTVIASTVSGNSASSDCGGIYNDGSSGGSATATVVNSTLSSNSAPTGYSGGIENDGISGSATLTVLNSTLSGNSSEYDGSAISSFGSATATVLNSTLSGNTAYSGGAIYNGSGTVKIGSTILNATTLSNSVGTIYSLGYNLSSDNGGGFLTSSGDQINKDPKLGPLQNNGGPTFTHALLIGSPAIDAGTNFNGLTTDQRGPGFARTVDISAISNAGDGTDIGAFELQASPAITSTNSVTFTAGYSNSFRIEATGLPTPAI